MNDTTRGALEAAAGFCLSRTNYNIEIEHFLMKLLDVQDSDFTRIIQHYRINKARLTAELTRSLETLKTGNGSSPSLSPNVVKLFERAWTLGSVDYASQKLRSGFTIVALLADEELSRIAREFSKELQIIQAEALRRDFFNIIAGSPEDETLNVPGEAPADTGAVPPAQGKTPNLDQYTVNLTENAKRGKIDTVLGRDFEIRQIVDILTRRRQNNPILTGEAGVGKTAVVEGFALRVAQGDVPPPLKNVVVRTLDLALLQAGAGIKGEFENRLKNLVEEVKKSPVPIILFIDEAHTMIGAGGQAGQNDAANILKPALARGELRTIAATTWSEYKKYFEKDPALARRFQVVKVEEPTEAQCMVMMRGIVPFLEKHHKVRILDDGLAAAVRLSHRYLAGRQLPDKAVSILDTACARLALSQSATPAALEDLTRHIDDLEVQERILRREAATGTDHDERLAHVVSQTATLKQAREEVKAKLEKVQGLVTKIRDIRTQLEEMADKSHAQAQAAAAGTAKAGGSSAATEAGGGATTAVSSAAATATATEVTNGSAGNGKPDGFALKTELADLTAQLDAIQGETPLMQVCVDAQIVGQVISGWTGIPVGKMVKDEIGMILEMENHLGRRVIGQNDALSVVAQRIRTGRASLDDPGKPVGVFLLVGPSGVGKTETALALSDLLYGGEHNLITINMSEFQEAHTVSTLKGSPPGYVGYGEGGVLTEAVRRRPYSVVLLDEVEKAHPDVLELFYQVFDKGHMEDGEGREIDFKNTIILLTTNACTDQLMKLCDDPETMPSPEAIVRTIKPELNKIFKPAFLGRMVVVPYFPVRDETLKRIVELKLGKIKRRMTENHKILLDYDGSVIDQVAKRCTEVESGARNVDNILTNSLLPDISRQLLSSISEGRKLSSIRVTIGEDGAFLYS
jgi:type VI secretion system protein VasG